MKLYLLLAVTVVAVVAQPSQDKSSEEEDAWPELRRGEPLPPVPQHPAIHEEIEEPVRPDEEERPIVRCKRLLECRMFCEHGFQHDQMGCPTCKCVVDPCQKSPCEKDETCRPVPGCHTKPCTTLQHKCMLPPPCAMPMCANHCENGYKTDEFGCMQCECKESVCEDHPCPHHHLCAPIPTPACKPGQRCGARPMCLPIGHEDNFHPYGKEPSIHDGIEDLLKKGFPQPVGDVFDKLCLFRQKFTDELQKQAKKQLANHTALGSILQGRAMHRPQCKENGDFHDVQCHFPDRQCWCVDDRGSPLKGTQKDVKRREDMPQCIPHKTTMLEGSFLLNHELENVKDHLEHIKNTIHEHLSKWLLMDKQFIFITKIEARNTKERVIVIEFRIEHDGKTDLTALERQLLWHFAQKHGSIPFLQSSLQPQPRSLKVNHHAKPMLPEHGLMIDEKPTNCFWRVYRHHKTAVIAGSIVGGAFFFLIVVAIVVTACKRRKMSAQFKHQRMTEKSEKYKQNLAYANQLYGGKVDIKGGDVVKMEDENNGEVQA